MSPNNYLLFERERVEARSKNQPPTFRRYAFSALLIVALLLVAVGVTYAATFTAGAGGNWNLGTTWGKSCASGCIAGTDYPGQNDTANISSTTATLTTNQSVGSTTISGTGVLNLGSYVLSVYNNWINTGTFNANTGTVNFVGTNQYLTGTSTFNNLTKTVTSADSISFGLSTTTVSGNLTLGGATGTPLTLQGFEENYVPSNIGTSSLANGVLNGSTFIALDSSGNIYVADTNGNRIEKFDSSGNFVSTFGVYGTGNGQLNTPYGIAIDSSNNIYVADSGNNRVEEFDSSGNYVTQWGTTGTAAGQFKTPRGIGIATSTGNIYVVDSANNRVQLFNSSLTFISTFGYGVTDGASTTEICTSSCRAGFASSTPGAFNTPYGIAVNSWGNAVYITDYANNRLEKFDLTGVFSNVFSGSGFSNGSTTNPYGIAIDKVGDIYLADRGNVRVKKFASTTGAYLSLFTPVSGVYGVTVDSNGNIFVSGGSLMAKYNSAYSKQFQSGISPSGNGTIYAPTYLTTDSSGNIFVSDSGNARVLKFDSSGNYLMTIGSSTAGSGNGQFNGYGNLGNSGGGPRDLAINASGNIIVADPANNRVEVFNSAGVYQTKFASTTFQISSLAMDPSGNIYTVNTAATKITKFDPSYNYILQWGSSGTGNGQFNNSGVLGGIAIDPTGSYVYISDTGNNRIEKFDSSGNYQSQWGSLGSGNGQFNVPKKVFVDSTGFVYVVDSGNNRIEKFDSNGIYLAQWGAYGTGAGQFNGPVGVTVDSSGNVYVADSYNDRIQKFHNLWQISATGSTSIAYATVKDSSNYGTAIKCFDCTDGGNNTGWSFITATAPTMAVATSSNIASSSVTLNSGITSDGNASSTIIGFNYGTSIAYGSATSTTGTYGNGYFSMNVTGLPCGGSVYHYQSFATNAVGTGTSSDATFTTGSCTSTVYPPTLGTATSSSVTYTTATLTDSIATDGGSASTIAGFNYGTSVLYGSVASTTGTYSAGNQWNIAVSGLTCSTTYHFQGYATNSGGTGTSSDQTLTTQTCPLSIASSSPSGDQPTWTYYTTLTFTTNEAATCKYATTSATTYAAISMSADTSSTTHSWPITAISSGHSYTYYPFCKDAALYENPVTPITFNIQADVTAPDLVNVSPTFIYFDTAIIQWNTTEPSDTLFEYGTSASLGTTIPLDHSLSIPHAITLTGLSPGITYYYKVTDKDKSGNSTSSPIQSFTTLSQNYAKEFFIATTANGGSNSNDGTIAHPYLTLEKAQTAMHTWRIANPSCSAPVMIWLRGGEYYRTSTLNLGGSDSGTTNCPTIFSGYGSENVVITGSQDISGFTKITSDDPFYSRLGATAQANVYKISLPAQGINDYGALNNVFNGGTSPVELVFNGKPMSLPRYPNTDGTNINTSSYTTSGSDPVLGYGSDTEPAGWTSSNDIWVHGWFKYDWSDHHQRVKSFDLVNKRITLDSSTTTSSNTGGRTANANNGYAVYNSCCAGFFYFENIFEELKSAGQYYIDRGTGTLYFWPPSDINLGRVQVTTASSTFVKATFASNVVFQNLTFENSRGSALYYMAANNLSVVHTIIHNMGGSAVSWSGGATNNDNGVYNSHIYDVGSAGISIYTITNSDLTGGRNFAVNNKIHNTGRWDVSNFGGYPITGWGPNLYISHNEIYNEHYAGMTLYNIVNNITEYNNIHDVMKGTNDGGGVYIGGDLNTRGNIVKYNYLHNIIGQAGNASAEGIYFDDETPGGIAYGNVMQTVAPTRLSAARDGGAFMIGGGRDTILENNILVNIQQGILDDYWSNSVTKLATISTTTYVYPRSTYFPQATLVYATSSTLIPEGTVIDKNIFYNADPPYHSTIYQSSGSYIDMRNNLSNLGNLSATSSLGNLLNTDPLFVDAANNNFNLQGGSPAYALGFQDIPFSQIGLMNSSDPVFNEVTYSGTVTAPTLTTSAASLVASSTLTLNATITGTGGADATESGFAYGTVADLSTVIATTSDGAQSGTASFSHPVSSLTPNTIYYFRAYAVNSAGTSTGAILSTTTLQWSVPDAPTSASAATSSPNQATVSFTPGSDGGSAILYYLASSTPGNFTATSTGSPIVVTGLVNATSYTFAVYAVNAVGTSSASADSNAVVPIDSVLPTYTIGGAVTGLSGTVVLQNNAGDNKSSSADGPFTFATSLLDSSSYLVTVLTQPSGQTCSVSSGSGSISAGDVTSVSVICADNSVTPTPTPTVTTSYSSSGGGSASSQVNNLITMGQYDLAQKIAKQYGLTIPTQNILQVAPIVSGPAFTRTLKLGMTGNDVKQLQVFLNAQGFVVAKKGAGSLGHETTYFGSATKAAMMKFQLAYKKEILDPQGLKSPTGFFGVATMKVINAMMK